MAEREIASDNVHALPKSEGNASETDLPDSLSDTEFDEKSESNAEPVDDMDDFGDEFQGAGASDDDFGEFGEFDDFGSAPEPVPIEPTPPRPLESVLSLFEALFETPNDRTEHIAALEKGVELGFGARCELSKETHEPYPLLPSTTVDTTVSRMLDDAEATDVEPRLVKNLLLIAASSDLSELHQTKLLTPLSEQSLSNNGRDIATDSEHIDISEIRRLAACSTGSLATNAGQELLRRALKSLDTMVALREQDVVKRRDAIDAYNQVIQTLVAQATRLH
ncbi:hypothetical protein GGH96_000747 [Coemansia sp. RSA 1972]|nr:hypothetical protein GGH96_000747 [Coemansia sp. RSA 1972]